MQKYEELKDQLAMAEEQADVASESEALRRAVAAVSSVRGIISGAVSDAADAFTVSDSADEEAKIKLEQKRVDALRAELDETETRLNDASDDDDEEPKSSSTKKSK
jgi:small-conductance mechanosensitive channel